MIDYALHHLPIGWTARLALLRLRAQWRSLVTVMIGVLLAAIIGANAPLYTRAIAQVGMVQRLQEEPDNNVNIFARVSIAGDSVDDLGGLWRTLDDAARAQAAAAFGGLPGWVRQDVSWGETAPMIVTQDGEDVPGARMRVAYYDGWQDALELVDGRWPAASSEAGVDLEGVIGVRAAAALGLSAGDIVVLDQRGWDSSTPVRTLITGTVREQDASSSYWFAPSPLRIDGTGEWHLDNNLFTSRDGLVRVAAEFIPQTQSQFGWRVLFDHSSLPFNEVAQAQSALAAFATNLKPALDEAGGGQYSVLYNTRLDDVLAGYGSEVEQLNGPFSVLLLQLGALVLFFLVVTAALVRRGERREIAILQSRGGEDRQILWMRGLEALFIAALAAFAAPFIARQILVWIVPGVTGVARLPLVLDGTVFLYSGGVALLALLILVLTLRPVMRLPLILAGGSASRSSGQAWWQRYYVDVVLLVIGIAALLRLVGTQSAGQSGPGHTLQGDPLLLLAPALLLVALGSVLLRLFPAGMRTLSRFFALRRGLGSALATWQVSREPAHYGRITFLLALAIGIGWFAVSFQDTTVQSQIDQARYEAGADVRLSETDRALGTPRASSAESYQAMSGVADVSQTFRYENVLLSGGRQLKYDVLGVNSATFDQTAYWRSDLGPMDIPTLGPLPSSGRELPVVPKTITVQARMDGWQGWEEQYTTFASGSSFQNRILNPLRYQVVMTAKLHDANGTFFVVPLAAGDMQTYGPYIPSPYDVGLTLRPPQNGWGNGWIVMQGDMSSLPFPLTPPISLDALEFSTMFNQYLGITYQNGLGVSLRGLNVTGADGADVALDWLAQPDGWQFVTETNTRLLDSLIDPNVRVPPAKPGEFHFMWLQDSERVSFSYTLDYPEISSTAAASSQQDDGAEITGIPALVSRSFAHDNDLAPGLNFRLFVNGSPLWFETARIIDYFPTLYNDTYPFIVVDRDTLLYTLNRLPGSAVYPNETWLRLTPGASAHSIADQLTLRQGGTSITSITTLDDSLGARQSDLLQQGLIGLLYLSFLIGVALSAISLLTYVALTVQARRSEFAVLRALGLPLSRIVRSILTEQILVVATSIVLGAVLGIFLSSQVLPTLAVSTKGQAITPPFTVYVETASLTRFGLVITGILLVILAVSAVMVRQLATLQALRLDEE